MENITNNSFPFEADIILQEINLTGLLVSLASVNSGLKVAISIDKPLDYTFQPELITLYPISIVNYFASRSSFKLLENIGSFYPTLVYPQRIVTFSENNKFKARVLSFTDSLFKRERDEASLPISFDNFKQFQLFDDDFKNAALIHEFRFDRNMAVIYLLRECVKKGVRIVTNKECCNAKVRVFCTKPMMEKKTLVIKGEYYPFMNNLRIANPFFETFVQKQEEKIIIRFLFKKPVDLSLFIRKTFGYMKSFGITNPEAYSDQLKEIYSTMKQKRADENNDYLSINDSAFIYLLNNCETILKKISSETGVKIRFKKWIKTLNPFNYTGDYFRKVQALCDEKFDLAKQTGIEYQHFCYFFFRYSEIIDDMIESAYNFIDENRGEPDIAWQNVENIFKKQINLSISNSIFC